MESELEYINEGKDSDIFSEEMKLRKDFTVFYEKNINKIINKNLKNFYIQTDKNTTSFLTGSRSWDHQLKKNPIYLTDIEKNSILPGNYDLFLLTNKKENIEKITENICVKLDKIIDELRKIEEINNNYDIMYLFNVENENVNDALGETKRTTTKHKFNIKDIMDKCPNNIKFENEGCVLPPCKSLHIELIFNPLNPQYASKQIFDKKVVLYIEIIYIKNISINKFKAFLLEYKNGFNYLNLRGLYLFSELIIYRNKDYDIDLYRNKILEKLYKSTEVDIKNEYLIMIHVYTELFSDRSDFDYKISKLFKQYIKLYDDDIFNDFTSNIIEVLRPFINTCLLDINDSLKEHDNDNILFITGGDAYRRHIKEIRRTNDIDAKIISRDPEQLVNMIIEKLCDLIVILYKNKHDIFPSNITRNIYKSKIKMRFKSIYDGGQFRLRIINRKDFKLFSIDYRSKIDIKLNNELAHNISHEIPFLDIVLTKGNTVEYKLDKGPFIVPVASAEYIKDDIMNIYKSISENLKSRYIKVRKDKDRLLHIINFIKNNKYLTNNRNTKRKIDDLVQNININITKPQNHKKINLLGTDLDYINISFKNLDLSNKKDTNIILSNTLERHFNDTYYSSLIDPSLKIEYYNLAKSEYLKGIELGMNKIQLKFNDIEEIQMI